MKIEDTKRIVVKVGSSLLFDQDTNTLNSEWLISLAEDIKKLREKGKQIIIVSSGAIALGRKQLNLDDNMSLDEKQAAAAVGQISLSHDWKETFMSKNITSAQILLAPDDTETRRKHINARATLEKILQMINKKR